MILMSVNSPSSPRPRRRRRPVQARSKQTVERILAAAAHVFSERGYAATTNHVAEAAGLSIGSLYQYFPNKDALLVALHSRHLEEVRAHLLGAGPVEDRDAWAAWLVSELIAVNTRPVASALWANSRIVSDMLDQSTALVDDLVADASRALPDHRPLQVRAVVVTALAVVHDLVLPNPTPARRRAAIDAVRAIADLPVAR
jgi:AcrR family transcriptional regulator